MLNNPLYFEDSLIVGTRSVIQLDIGDDISEEEKFELERLLCEIWAKNGLPPESRLVYRTGRIVS